MKKFLLSLLALLSFSVYSFGAALSEDEVISELTFPAYNDKSIGSYTDEWTATKDKLTWTFNAFNNNKNGWAYIRCGRKNNASTATILSPQVVGGKATKLVLTIDKTANVSAVTVTPILESNVGTAFNLQLEKWVAGDVELSIPSTVNADQIMVTIENASASANGPTQISKLVLYGSTGEPAAVAAPVITPKTGTYFGEQEVTMTCATEGATIRYSVYYTDEGLGERMLTYSAPFKVSKTAKITAWAELISDSDAAQASAETTVTLTIAEPYTSITEVNAAATATKTAVGLQANEWLVTYASGMYTYLTDGVAGLLIYGNGVGLEQGQKVSGIITGQLYTYNGLPEVANPNVDGLEVVSEGNEVAPIVVASSALAADKLKWVNMFVEVNKAAPEENVGTDGSKVENYSFFSEDVELVVRNQFKIAIDAVADQQYTIRGILGIYNDDAQLYPTAIEEYLDPSTVMGDVTEFYLSNPSFELDMNGEPLTAEQKFSNGAGGIFDWTWMNVGTQFNNTELLNANSTSSSQFGSSGPSDGSYSLFFRQGWNGNGNTITLTSSLKEELPAGNYILSVDYKQHYSYDTDNQKNENTKVGISLNFQMEAYGEAISEAAAGVKGSGATNYFADEEWKTLEAMITLDSPMLLDAVITLYSCGARRSDFFIDNVRLIRISEADISRMYLQKDLEMATDLLNELYGQLFTKTEEAHEALEAAAEVAQEVYDNEEATAEEIDQAASALLSAIETYENSDLILPDPDKKYTFRLKDGGMYLSLDTETDKRAELSEEPQAFYFQELSDVVGYALYDGKQYYVAQAGDNLWNMALLESAFAWTFQPQTDGSYAIAQTNAEGNCIGVDNTTAGSACYANKTVAAQGDKAKWIIEEYVAPATVLEGIAALKSFTLGDDEESAEVVLRLDGAKVTFTCEGEDIDYDTWEAITVDEVVMEDVTAGVFFKGLGLGSYLKAGDKVSGDIILTVTNYYGQPLYSANDNTEASLQALTVEAGEATPLEVTDDNVLEYAENSDWIFASFKDVEVVVEASSYGGEDVNLNIPVMGDTYGVVDILGIYPEGLDVEDGQTVEVEGYIYSIYGLTAFQPVSIKVQSVFENPADVFTANTARGAWMYDEANNCMHYGTLPDEVTDAFKFAFIEKDGEKFLYSVGAGKFIQPQKYLVEGMPTPVEVNEYDSYVIVKSANTPYTINIGGNQWTWDTWSTADDGNKVTIEKVGEFDATEALAMLENGAIDSHKVFNITTNRGQWAVGNGLASVATNPNASEADKQFAFYYDGSELYIYSVGAKKFLKKDGSLFEGKGDPVDYRIVATSGKDHCFFFTDGLIYFNMQNSGAYALNTWSTPDDGNKQELTEVADVDVFEEMEKVFNTKLIDVEYELVYDGEVVGTATASNAVGSAPELPAELDNELCEYTFDVEEITEDTKKVTVTAEWIGPFEFSESFEDAKWYNMKIRGDYWIALDETEPYYPTTDKDLTAETSQWAFVGNPYNVVLYNRSLSGSWSLQPETVENTTEEGEPVSTYCAVMREGSYAWDIFGNGDGFVLREKGTPNNYVNQAGGSTGPLAYWNSTSGRRDAGSTILVEPVAEPGDALVLDVDVDYYKGQNGLNYEVDFTEALEYLGIESLDYASIYGVDVTTDADVEDYVRYDGWRNADGDYQQWGGDAAVCVKFVEEPEQFAIYDMGNDNVPEVGETFTARFRIYSEGKIVVYNINVNFVDQPAKYLADYTEKGSFDVTIFASEEGVAFDGQESEAFEEAAVSELIGEMWSEVYGKGAADEVGETFATNYSCDPAPGFWCLADGTADVYDNGTFGVSLIPAEDWTTFTFQAWTKEALEENATTTFYFVNEETKEYVAYNITLSSKPAVNLVGTFDGIIKQILSHPQTGKQGEATGEQTVTIAEGEEEGTYDITFSGFTMPVTGAELPEFTVTGVEAEISEDGTTANYVLPAWAPQTITIGRGTGSVTYKIALEGTKEGNDTPVLKLTLDNSVVDDVYFGADEKTVDKAIATDEADGIRGINGFDNAGTIFDLSGRKVEKVQKSGIYIVNGKKVSVK
ncbi:MAG: hypothetical protein IJ209_08320 [Bacteroidaceae bacterium]|nr:hypothetical protein [Bacteroidaceae bacterium]